MILTATVAVAMAVFEVTTDVLDHAAGRAEEN